MSTDKDGRVVESTPIVTFTHDEGAKGFQMVPLADNNNTIKGDYSYLVKFTDDGQFLEGKGYGAPSATFSQGLEITENEDLVVVLTTRYGGHILGEEGNGNGNTIVMKLDRNSIKQIPVI